MKLGNIKTLMVKHLGNYTNDADDPNVIAQYMPEALAYINEAYVMAMQRYDPSGYVNALTEDEDEPLFEPAAFHSILADYAAARIMLSEPGKTEKASHLMAQWANGLFQVLQPDYKLYNRWN